MPRVLALSGSLRAGSHSTSLLRHAAARAGDDIELILYEGLREIPPFDEDSEGDEALVAPVERLKQALRDADAVLIATPEYNGSVSGVLKNALDWVSRPFDTNPLRGKHVAVISASTGSFGGLWAQNDLRRILGHPRCPRAGRQRDGAVRAHDRRRGGRGRPPRDERRPRGARAVAAGRARRRGPEGDGLGTGRRHTLPGVALRSRSVQLRRWARARGRARQRPAARADPRPRRHVPLLARVGASARAALPRADARRAGVRRLGSCGAPVLVARRGRAHARGVRGASERSRPLLVGHSLGGPIAALAAGASPERVVGRRARVDDGALAASARGAGTCCCRSCSARCAIPVPGRTCWRSHAWAPGASSSARCSPGPPSSTRSTRACSSVAPRSRASSTTRSRRRSPAICATRLRELPLPLGIVWGEHDKTRLGRRRRARATAPARRACADRARRGPPSDGRAPRRVRDGARAPSRPMAGTPTRRG